MFNTTTSTRSTATATPAVEPFSLLGILATLFFLDLRQQLNEIDSADQGEAAYHYGM